MGVISGFAPVIPMRYTEGDGFDMAEDADASIEADFICLLLSCGKIHDDAFGGCLSKYLFEQFEQLDFGEIESTIYDQVRKYLDNYLSIVSVNFITPDDDPTLSPHVLIIQIRAQSKVTGAAIPVSVSLDAAVGALSYASRKTTFTGEQHNWLFTE
jgi:hypothetical protein